MASLKGFFSTTKKRRGNAKPSFGTNSRKRSAKSGEPTTVGDPKPHNAAVNPREEEEEEEERLRQFDMDMRYGPCIGMMRLERWNRAAGMGLSPPPEVGDILQRLSSNYTKPKPELMESLWNNRI